MEKDVLRQQVLELVRGGHAHMNFEEAIKDFPLDAINQKPINVPYTPWHLLEHLRRVQADILEFIINPKYQDKQWPDDFWPPQDQTATPQEWQTTIDQFNQDLTALIHIVENPDIDLTTPVPYAPQPHFTYLREMLLVADHNAYHIGEFAILRQVMETW